MSVDSFENAFSVLQSVEAELTPMSTSETKTGILLAEPRVSQKNGNMTWYKLRVEGKMIELSIFDDLLHPMEIQIQRQYGSQKTSNPST